MWGVIVLVPDHCLSIYSADCKTYPNSEDSDYTEGNN